MKLNIGAGKEIKDGFVGVDKIDFGQMYVDDALHCMEGMESNSVDEAYSRHFLPCLTNLGGKFERVKFFNELYRILKPGAFCTLVIPPWNFAGGYGNPHFQEPFYEGGFYFLNKEWREVNAPEVAEYTCNFDIPQWGYNMHPSIAPKNQEYQQFALSNYCNSALDVMTTLRKPADAPVEVPAKKKKVKR